MRIYFLIPVLLAGFGACIPLHDRPSADEGDGGETDAASPDASETDGGATDGAPTDAARTDAAPAEPGICMGSPCSERLVAAGLGTGVGSVAVAGRYVYWTEGVGTDSGVVRRLPLDAACVQNCGEILATGLRFSAVGLRGIQPLVAAGDRVCFSERDAAGTGGIVRCGNENLALLAEEAAPIDALTADGDQVLWAADETKSGPSRLRSASLADAVPSPTTVLRDQNSRYAIAYRDGGGAWAAQNATGFQFFSGSASTAALPARSYATGLLAGVAVGGSFAYWASSSSGTTDIYRAPWAGGAPTPIATGRNRPRHLRAVGSSLYWLDRAGVFGSSGARFFVAENPGEALIAFAIRPNEQFAYLLRSGSLYGAQIVR